VLSKVDAPATEFRSPLEIFKKALVLEESVTKSIHEIYEAAFELKDFGTLEMLNWFLKEQVEEEEVTTDWIDKLTLAGDDVSAHLRLDHEAGKTKE
jgi:ferritin